MSNKVADKLSKIYDTFNPEQRAFIQQIMDRVLEQEQTIVLLQARCRGFLDSLHMETKCDICSLKCRSRFNSEANS